MPDLICEANFREETRVGQTRKIAEVELEKLIHIFIHGINILMHFGKGAALVIAHDYKAWHLPKSPLMRACHRRWVRMEEMK
ncbi:hypothetical protein WL1483_1757 [Aeromonas schubertii]|uniref:Uncharacterized protein n=1 Tax=Aeromonas schubertii TaxID=652 RepID=A0A0S2SHH3_9GAMM|nr:hypothetical protein WL1483_1757 [Aeromonas schubertii]